MKEKEGGSLGFLRLRCFFFFLFRVRVCLCVFVFFFQIGIVAGILGLAGLFFGCGCFSLSEGK